MKHPFPLRIFVAFAAIAACATAAAQQLPQWSRPLTTEQGSEESTFDWAVAGNGDRVLATRLYGDLVVRRVLPQGGYRYVRAVQRNSMPQPPSYPEQAALALDPLSDAVWVLYSGRDPDNGGPRCNLLRIGADGRRELTLGVDSQATEAGECLSLAVLPDQSVAVLRAGRLLLFNVDGSLRWQRLLPDTALRSSGAALLVDAQQRIVVLGNVPVARLSRFRADGTPDVSSTIAPGEVGVRLHGMDLLPNGDIAVSGQLDPSGSAARSGLLALARPDGGTQTLHVSAVDEPFLRSSHDDAGTLYVEAQDVTVHALDGVTGQLRWIRQGRSPSGVASGVVLVRGGGEAASADLLAPDGATQWSRLIPYRAVIDAATRRGANGQLQVRAEPYDSSAACGRSPALLTLAADSTIVSNWHICTIEAAAPVRRLAAAASGVTAIAPDKTFTFDDAGRSRWSIDADAVPAAAPGSYIVDAALLPDGGAWLVSAQGPARVLSPPNAPTSMALRRLAPDGSELKKWNVPLPPDNYHLSQVGLLADADEAVLLLIRRNGVRWIRFTRSGDLREIRDFDLGLDTLSMTVPFFAAAPRRLDSGDVVFALATYRECGFLCPPLPQTNTLGLMRLGRDGAERWRYVAPRWYSPFAGFHSDGSALAASAHGAGGYTEFVVISPQGAATVQQPALDLVRIVGPSRDRYLALDIDGTSYALAADGSFTPVTLGLSSWYRLGASEDGFLIGGSEVSADAVLIDPQSYTEAARFDIDGLPNDPLQTGQVDWSAGDDGSWYAASYRASGPDSASFGSRLLSRFAVPGTAAADRIFIDTFE